MCIFNTFIATNFTFSTAWCRKVTSSFPRLLPQETKEIYCFSSRESWQRTEQKKILSRNLHSELCNYLAINYNIRYNTKIGNTGKKVHLCMNMLLNLTWHFSHILPFCYKQLYLLRTVKIAFLPQANCCGPKLLTGSTGAVLQPILSLTN